MSGTAGTRDTYMQALRDSKQKRLESNRNMQLQYLERSSAARNLKPSNGSRSRMDEEQHPGTDSDNFNENDASANNIGSIAEGPDDHSGRRVAMYAASGTNAIVAWRELVLDTIKADIDDEMMNDEGHSDSHEHSLPLYAAPIQRQKWGEDQILPHINWGDLFFDLFYVAAAYNLGALLISTMNPKLWFHGVVYFIGIFGPLFNAWESKLVFDARYSVIDYFHRLVEVVRIIFVSFSVLHIKPIELMSDPRSAESFCFCLGLFLECCVRIFLKSELIRVGKGDVEAIRNHSGRKLMFSYGPLALFYLAGVIIAAVQYWGQEDSSYDSGYNNDAKDADYAKDAYGDGEHRFLAESKPLGNYSNSWSTADLPIALCAMAYVFNLIFTIIRKVFWLSNSEDFRKENVPSNIDFCIHRYGEWTMLMLGEAVLSLLIVETTEDFDYYIVALLGVLTVIMIQALHFESEPSHADHHALWRNMQAGLWYSVFLQFLSMGLIAFGVSYKVMLKGIHKDASKAADYGGGYSDGASSGYGDEGNSGGYGDRGADYGGGDGRFLIEDAYIGGDGSLLDFSRRFLAGSVEVSDEAAAGLFCGSLTITLISLELLTITHRGVQENFKRMYKSEKSGISGLKVEIVFLTMLKIGIIIFLATLSQWLVDPKWIVLVGCASVAFLAGSRVLVWRAVHGIAEQHH